MSKTIDLGKVTAYAIAVDNGFVGTETEWLASLGARIGENGNWWVGDKDLGVLADPAQLQELTGQASEAAASAAASAQEIAAAAAQIERNAQGIDELKSDLEDNASTIGSYTSPVIRKVFMEGYYLSMYDRLIEHSGSSYITNMIPCYYGDVFLYKGSGRENVASVIWYDKNKKYLSSEQYDSNSDFSEIPVPIDACFAKFSSFAYKSSNTEVVLDIRIKRGEDVLGIESRVYDAEKNINALTKMEIPVGEKKDIVLKTELNTGYLYYDGSIIQDVGSHSDYISIEEYPVVFVTSSSQYNARLFAIYDKNKKFIALLDDILPVKKDSGKKKLLDAKIKFSLIKETYQNASYFRVGLYPTNENFELYTKENESIDDYIEKSIKSVEDKVGSLGNVLYGKKYIACGDSFTEGDFTGYIDAEGNTGKNSDAYDSVQRMYKTYPWWIAKRNNMTLINEAKCGSDFTNIEGASNPFSVSRYLAVPMDADYITLMFGLNETGLTTEQIGTNTDTDNTTLWGAYNIVFEYFLTNMPYAKIGVIIADAWMAKKYADAVKEICSYWGIPVLDMKFDTSVPLGMGGRTDGSAVAKNLRNNAFYVSSTNGHPNLKAHEYRSTFIENWLRSL